MAPVNQLSLAEYRKKSKEELVHDLIILRNKYHLLEQSLARCDRFLEYEKSPDTAFERLEVQRAAIERLEAEALKSVAEHQAYSEEFQMQNEELRVLNEQLEVQKEEILKRNTELEKTKGDLLTSETSAEMYLDLMGHDITNINQIVMGYLELALDMGEGEKDELILKALGALEDGTKLIGTVKRLQLMKGANINLYPADVGQMLDKALSGFANVPGRQITINKKCDEEGCLVLADDLLKDVFSNIVGNAIKHSDGPLTINVLLKKQKWKRGSKRDYYRVSIEDDGPGVPDKEKEAIFNRFQSGKRNTMGRGLGLYMVKTIVESYQGKAWVEDRVKGDHTKGARFVVMLPAADYSHS